MRTITDLICDLGSAGGNITVSSSIYDLKAIYAATYEFTDRYHIMITPNVDTSVTVIFQAKDKNRDVNEDIKDFANALIDHQVRHQLDKTNGKIRDLIVAHALSPLDLHKDDGSL